MYVTVVPNRNSPPAVLLRETYRDGDKVKNRTLANLTRWNPEKIAALRAVLRNERRRLPFSWIAAPPGWLSVMPAPAAADPAFASLDDGERAAIVIGSSSSSRTTVGIETPPNSCGSRSIRPLLRLADMGPFSRFPLST